MDIRHIPDSVLIRPSILYFGTPVVLITTRNPDGSTNITPMSSAWALADRVVIGLAGGGQGQFVHPYGIAIDKDGNVFVSDTGNKRIEKFAPGHLASSQSS